MKPKNNTEALSSAVPLHCRVGLPSKIKAHLRQLSPHMMQRDGVVLLIEAQAEIAHEQNRGNVLAATIRDLQNVVTSDCESKDEFIIRIRNVLGADPDLRVMPNVKLRGRAL